MGIVSLAVIKLSLVALFGFYLYKKAIIGQQVLEFLTFFVINFSVPFLIFSHLIANSKMVLENSVWVFLIASMAIFFVGYLLGIIVGSKKNNEFKKEFLGLVSFQNAGYLPMNIALFLFPQGLREKFLVYVFLYLLGFNIIMWSLGSFFIFRKQDEKFKLKDLFTPPVTSTILALVLIYTNIARFVPSIILSPVKMIGQSSFVLSMIVLGCWLAKVSLKGITKKLFVLAEAAFIKLFVVPFMFFLGMMVFKIYSFFGIFMILQAAMPSAASLPIIAKMRGADSEFTSQGVFATHVLSIFTIPLWLGLYLKLSGLSF